MRPHLGTRAGFTARTLALVALVVLTGACDSGAATTLAEQAAARGATASDDELRRYVDELLDASGGQADSIRVLDGPPDLDALMEQMSKSRQNSYPSTQPAAIAARRALLAAGARSVPHVLAGMRASDPNTHAGSARGQFGNDLLQELAGVWRGWPSGKRGAESRPKVIAEWTELWDLTSSQPELWSGRQSTRIGPHPHADRLTALRFVALETVMQPGDSIRATTSVGTITVEATAGYERTYGWAGARRTAMLDPRNQRWYGALGLYSGGPSGYWEEHAGITRPVMQEAQIHHATLDEALAWIETQRGYAPVVYRNDGLLVSWSTHLPREQINVNVWQITVGGKAPTELPGSTDDAIVLTRGG